MNIIDAIGGILFTLHRLDMIKGYGISRTGKSYRGHEDMLWDVAHDGVEAGRILNKILEIRMLNKKQLKYIELEKKKQEYKTFLEEFKAVTEELSEEMGLGGHFQDADGIVYQIFEGTGKFVHFDKYEVKRTKRPGERAGALSVTKAKELGYDVK